MIPFVKDIHSRRRLSPPYWICRRFMTLIGWYFYFDFWTLILDLDSSFDFLNKSVLTMSIVARCVKATWSKWDGGEVLLPRDVHGHCTSLVTCLSPLVFSPLLSLSADAVVVRFQRSSTLVPDSSTCAGMLASSMTSHLWSHRLVGSSLRQSSQLHLPSARRLIRQTETLILEVIVRPSAHLVLEMLHSGGNKVIIIILFTQLWLSLCSLIQLHCFLNMRFKKT